MKSPVKVKSRSAKHTKHMKTQQSKSKKISGLWLPLLAVMLACLNLRAQTLVSGNISGTWSSSGNPYIVAGNCTVPAGTNLTIQPGVIVTIGGGLAITNNGLIQAVGTPNQRITFRSPGSSQYWTNIVLNYANGTNRFKYCDFQNADTAIRMGVYGGSRVMSVEIMNCTFTNCITQGVYGEAAGGSTSNPPLGPVYLNPTIKNCTFNNMSNGCVMNLFGVIYFTPQSV